MPDAFAAQERVIGDRHRNLQLPAKRLAVSSLHYTYTAGLFRVLAGATYV